MSKKETEDRQSKNSKTNEREIELFVTRETHKSVRSEKDRKKRKREEEY